ncbi:TetR family transcriptional regulator [Micromonospora sp. KC213]|uniref:TetR/AcrR family transcriptional regulator n=1 Tax=Micromonospora sp. KC213 TaxID=2530378 RepID=UPI00104DC8FC|nr:TetR family transcriptional regulator [Micromonospora sp. KC213]TDC43797.1 TetR family transcriptional regulator [Micromonospora sp. KC213]
MEARDLRDPTAQGSGLRARKRRQTERRIQAAALGLFERYGFDAVTVEQVAAEADVSVVTVYRYFVTKENLVLQDPFEGELTDAILEAIRTGHDIPAAVQHVLEQLPAERAEDTEQDARVRIRLANEIPAIAGAAHIRARARARQLVEALPGGLADRLDARVQALATFAALEAAADHWHDVPDAGTLRDVSLAAVRTLRTTW